jgi:hypothetical protein
MAGEERVLSQNPVGCVKRVWSPPWTTTITSNFDAPATLRKWPSIKNERARAADGPYLIVDGTLDDCIRQFMAKPASQHHLYEIHTAPQGELVSAVLSAIHILEIVRLRDFL